MDRFEHKGDSQMAKVKHHCSACGRAIYEGELAYNCQDEVCHKDCLNVLVDAELFTAGEDE